jgi:hypothetical protein
MAKISFQPNGYEEWHPLNELKKVNNSFSNGGGVSGLNDLIRG